MRLIWQRESNRKGPTSSSEQEGPKTPDPKVNSSNFFLSFFLIHPFQASY